MKLVNFIKEVDFNRIVLRTEGLVAFDGTKEELEKYSQYDYLLENSIKSISSIRMKYLQGTQTFLRNQINVALQTLKQG